MSSIFCAHSLWRLLDPAARGSDVPAAPAHRAPRLGPWYAKTFKEDGRKYVLAVDERTLAALVCTLDPIGDLVPRLGDALRALLLELEVMPVLIDAEVEALRGAPLCRTVRNPIGEELGQLQYICGIELMYHTDLCVVVSNLNEFPHARPPHGSKPALRDVLLAAPFQSGDLRPC